jgi:hypothetical protein
MTPVWQNQPKIRVTAKAQNLQVSKLHIFTFDLRAISTSFSLLCPGLWKESFCVFLRLQLHSFFSSNPRVLQVHTILFLLVLLPSLFLMLIFV